MTSDRTKIWLTLTDEELRIIRSLGPLPSDILNIARLRIDNLPALIEHHPGGWHAGWRGKGLAA